MIKTTNKALRVGLFVFSAILIFVVAIYLIGSKDNLFKSKTRIKTSFSDIRGVVVGNNVRFSGITVGKVSSIYMKSADEVILELDIVNNYKKHIYKDAVVEITQDGLMGSKLINISTGTATAGSVEEGSYLKGKEGIDVENMLSQARDILVQANSAVISLKSIANKIDTGDGDLGRLVNDNTLTTQLATTTQRLNSTLANIDQITQKMNNGEGDFAALINNNQFTNKTSSILSQLNSTAERTNQVADDLAKTTNSINNGGGTINMLLNDQITAQKIDTAITKVQSSLQQFDRTAKAIEDSWIVKLFSKKKKKDVQKDSIN
ncbi:MAG: MlaD family protein [Paludibacteraceae bacterium]